MTFEHTSILACGGSAPAPQAFLENPPQALLENPPQALLKKAPEALLESLPEAHLETAPTSLATIRRLVADILAGQGQTAPFGDNDTLAEIGIGSVDMVALLLALECAFDLEVPQHEITIDVFRSVGTLNAMVRRVKSPARAFTAPVHATMTLELCDNAGA